jgi:hypothetical protein
MLSAEALTTSSELMRGQAGQRIFQLRRGFKAPLLIFIECGVLCETAILNLGAGDVREFRIFPRGHFLSCVGSQRSVDVASLTVGRHGCGANEYQVTNSNAISRYV